MNWQEIEVSEDRTHFVWRGKPLFNRVFLEVGSFHAPGLAPVRDESGITEETRFTTNATNAPLDFILVEPL
ncbi:MAG: hypothetical protein ACUVRD_09210 [Bacteroidia bacterium]